MGLIGDPFELYESNKFVEFSGIPPDSWDWRDATYDGITGNWVTPIRDQGQCGSCATFGSLACLESAYRMKNKDPNMQVDFSEQFLVSCGQEWVGDKNLFIKMRGCEGATIFGVLHFIKEYGAINETCFPYTSGIEGYEPPCSDKCEDWKEQRIHIKDYQLVMGEYNEKEEYYDISDYKNALINYGPLVTSMIVYEDFPDYTDGIYEFDRSSNLKQLGGHMVAIVGYKDDPSIDSGGYWICKNSWGEEWGEDGYFRIKYDDFYVWYYNEIDERTNNMNNFRDFIELLIWTYSVMSNPPSVGIGYLPSAFFTGLTKKSLETYIPRVLDRKLPSLQIFTLFHNLFN